MCVLYISYVWCVYPMLRLYFFVIMMIKINRWIYNDKKEKDCNEMIYIHKYKNS